jgi:hypothetical protein
MKRLCAVLIASIFIFSSIVPSLSAAPKPAKPKIDIKKVTLEAEVKGAVPSGIPLMVLVEIHASQDIAGPFDVDLELKKGKEKQNFKEGIEKLSQGPNSFKWDLKGQPEDGPYVVAVEIAHPELKLKDKFTKSFKIGGKKKSAGAEGKSETEAEKTPKDPGAKAEPHAAATKPAKQGKPKIDIKNVNLENEEKGAVPSGLPLMVLVEINASADIAGPLDVNLELKKGKEKQSFKEGIEKLSQGPNSFKWDLTGAPEDGPYVVSVEIASAEPKLKDKFTKQFRVGEKKKAGSGKKKSEPTGAKKAEGESETTDAVGTEASKSETQSDAKSKTSKSKTTKSSGTKGAGEVKEITFAGVRLTGSFREESSGVYIGRGKITPDWDYKVTLNAEGDLTIDTRQKQITGQLSINVPVLGEIGKVTELDISTSGINFNGEAVGAVKLGSLTFQLAKAAVLFKLSSSKIKAEAEAGLGINVTGIPGIKEINIDIQSVDAGFETPIEHPELTVSGSGTVEIPPTPVTPPLKVDLSGNLGLRLDGLSGDGKVKVFDIEVGNGDFNINTKGIISINITAGIFEEGVVECGLAGTTITLDMPKGLLNAGLSQELKLFDAITIPGSVKADLEVNARTKKMKVSGGAGIPLTGSVIAPEELSLGIKDFVFEMDPYNSTNPKIKINGDAYISLWTLAGFSGDINNAVLDGKGNFLLPPGLKQLLDIEKITLPVKVDLKSAQVLAGLGGDVGKLAIKHFPITGPEIIVKNDGVHLKGQIGIANVITIPLGDIVFTQTSSQTEVNGDIGIGPFTVAEGKITLPAKESDGFGFSGKMGIPGLSAQEISGTVYKDGNTAKANLSGMTSIGFITVDALTKFSVSTEKLHADRAGFSVAIGKAAKCALAFTSLDINKSAISGIATATFTGILGVEVPLRGSFLFDGETETIKLTYLDAVSLCGISVDKVTLRINKDGVTGSGTISAAGQSTNISITVENGIMKLKGPMGELIAEGMRVVGQLGDTASEIASEEKKVVGEDVNDTLDNLSRMTEPWVKDVVAVARAVKSVYSAIEKVVVEEITKQVNAALDDLKKVIDAAVLFAKQAIAAAVDAVCNGILAMVDGVKAIFSQIEAIIPAEYLASYRTIKAKVIEKADAVKVAVVAFRDSTKASLYNLTGTITAIYQAAIDEVTDKANKIAGKIKKELDPVIQEIDLLLTEIGQEIDQATTATGDEAERHYSAAKRKAEALKEKGNGVISKYKNKLGDLLEPYTDPILKKIKSDQDKVAKERDAVIAKGIEGLKAAQKTLDPVIQPFEAAVKELRDLTSAVGGAVYQKFLDGVGAAGDAMNTALGTAGKGLVKVSDVVGDAAVAVSGAAADISEGLHDAAVVTVNFVQDTGAQAVNVAVDTAQEGYQTATQAANQAAAAASQAASQAYQTAMQVTTAAQKQVESTVNTVISNLPPVTPSSFATGMPLSFSDIQSGAATISAKVSDILNALDGYATGAYNAVSGTASSVGSAISSGASAVASGIASRWKSATRSVSSFFGSSNPAPAPKVDYTAPAVTNIAATSTTTSITITWNTSFNSRTIMFYGATPNLSFSGQDANTTVVSIHDGPNYPETMNHSITVSGLNPGTAYYYIVYAVSGMAGGSTDAGKKGPFLIVTQPSTAIIGGLVKDAAGSGIAGAKIYQGHASTPVATTDATGRYTLEVNPGVQTVTVKKDNYLNSSTATPNLIAGQILPLDFTLADGRIWVSGTVKDAGTNTALAGVSVTLTGLATPTGVTTDANGTFTIALGTAGSAVQFSISAAKAGYTAYASNPMSVAPGTKVQNIEIKLPHVAPAVSSEGVSVLGIYATQVTVSFETQVYCSAFVQLGLQSGANYTYQTPAKANENAFYFDLVGLSPATAYKYKVVLQDSFGNTVVAKESTFTTASAVSATTDIGLNATVTPVTGNSAKLNITSAFKTLKHQLVLRDTTANTQISSQDLGLLVSPVSIDLKNLTDGHSYTADLTSSLLANVTSGNVIKTATKNVSFQVPRLKDFVIQNLKCNPENVKRGTTTTVSVSSTVRINHAVTGAVLKVFADTKELCSQNLGNLSASEMQASVPLAVTSIPGTGSVAIKLKVQAAGNIQETSTQTISITGPQNQGKPGGATAV